MGGNGVVSRSVANSLRLRAVIGLPVGKHIVPEKPLPVNDELIWDNGTPFPEPCLDRIADTVWKYEALACVCGGLSFFTSLDCWLFEMIKPPRYLLHRGFMTAYELSLAKNQRHLGEIHDKAMLFDIRVVSCLFVCF